MPGNILSARNTGIRKIDKVLCPHRVYTLEQGLPSFSVKCEIINIWGFVDHAVSIATTQLYSCSVNATKDNMYQYDFIYKNKHRV